MSYETMATIILFGSLLGMGVILYRKIPQLSDLPETQAEFNLKKNLLKLKENIKIFPPFKDFSAEIFLQKLLSKIRVLALKTENKIGNWLQRLREKTKNKKLDDDNYWEELKKSTKNETSKRTNRV
jgi:hypothetical protein